MTSTHFPRCSASEPSPAPSSRGRVAAGAVEPTSAPEAPFLEEPEGEQPDHGEHGDHGEKGFGAHRRQSVVGEPAAALAET